SLAMTQGLDRERAREQWEQIDKINRSFDDFQVLRSMEVDILEDGSLDMDDETLAMMDIVVASVHSHLDLDPEEQTGRIIRGISHPAVDILAHPTERKIQQRDPMAFDMEAMLEAAVENNVAVELNAQPDRLDLPDRQARLAKEVGARIVISTDAHRVEELGLIQYGVDQARRAWLEPSDVLNTLKLEDLKAEVGA
ncbi:MAG: PHP domain-containing protein, partial [Anaerolineales bacterium]